MERVASIMYLYPGNQEEYKKRHDALWPEMKEALKAHGAANYSIFLDEKTRIHCLLMWKSRIKPFMTK